MKNLKTILEIRREPQPESNKNLSVLLNKDKLSKLLFALAFTRKWNDDLNKWDRAEYESLYLSLYKEASKTFGKEELEDLGIEDDIEKVQTRY